MNRRAFTLLEMLLATALAAVLMAAVLSVLAGVSRDRRRLTTAQTSPRLQSLIERIRWDLTNAATMSQSRDGRSVVLIGHGAIDHQTLASTGRLVRVTYLAVEARRQSYLIREQEYLDDPARPERWCELVAGDVRNLQLIAESGDAFVLESDDPDAADGVVNTSIPSRVRLHVDMNPTTIDEELWIK